MHTEPVPHRPSLPPSRTAAWFGDLGDGVHKGDQHDPRVAPIEVVPDEIRYWVATRGAVGRALDVAVSAVTGRSAAPGDLVTISKDEVSWFCVRVEGEGLTLIVGCA